MNSETLTDSPDRVLGSDILSFAEIVPAVIDLYPVELHVAEKLHVLTLPRDRLNSRVKDLPDIVLLATTKKISGKDLRVAIENIFQQRATHSIPSVLPTAPPSWAPVYERMARLNGWRWGSLVDLEKSVRTFLNPALIEDPGLWSPASWRWETGKKEI